MLWLRERGALALGVGAAVALFGLARSPLFDREAEIGRDVELITRSVETEVQRVWSLGTFRPTLAPLAVRDQGSYLPLMAPEAVRPIDLTPQERDTAFDFLLQESQRAELAGDPRQALIDLEDARAATDDPRRRLAADLRTIQIAAKVPDPELLAATIPLLLAQTDGRETLDGISVLLTAAVTTLSLVNDTPSDAWTTARAALLEATRDALAASRLALPPLEASLVRDGDAPRLRMNPLRQVYLKPLRQAGDEDLSELVDQRLEHDRFAWLARHFGEPALPQQGNAIDALLPQSELSTSADALLVTLARPDARAQIDAWVLTLDELRPQLAAWFREEAEVPDEVRLTFELLPPDDLPRVMHPRLHDTPLTFHASLIDPAAYRRDAASGYRWLRLAMRALAVMALLLAWAVHRQRQRELAVQKIKSEFVANVSHELRTPLSSILLMAENLRGGKVGVDTQRQYHELILRESQRLRRLVDDVLDFSRIERGEGPRARLETVSLARFADELEADLHSWAAQHGLELSWRASTPEGDALAADDQAVLDEEALRRALFNLADNARRHAPGSALELQLVREATQLLFRCRDHGPGLPSGSEEQIFRPFEQLDPSSTDGKGAGLGLAIVAEIARAHAGHVRAHNHPDGGAVFELTIPVHQDS